MSTIRIAKETLRENSAIRFHWKKEGKIYDGVLISRQGHYFVYENLCQHLAINLDAGDGKFFCENEEFLQCHMHGAMYEVETGRCVAGPCVESFLHKISFQETKDEIIISPD